VTTGVMNKREVAHRLFAAEFNASRVEIKGSSDERSPGYVVSPLGAKVNRLLLVGVLTEVEAVGESGDLQRARISDPTGLFTVYAGRYQPGASAALSELQAPQYVAVVGKARTYEPEPGKILVSVRPESVTVVDEYVRDHWLLETARHTRTRLAAMKQATGLEAPTAETLEKLAVPRHLIDGVLLAREKYQGDVDFDFFDRLAKDAVQGLAEGPGLDRAAAPALRPVVTATPKPRGPGDEVEKKVLDIIQTLAQNDEKGAQWDLIVSLGEKSKITEDQVEEALNSLMDKGVVYEPILGRLKMA
jgi:uncharacterized protein